jgi:hypothetical protein
MRKILMLFIFIFSIKSFCQIKKDTVYLLFKYSKSEIHGLGGRKDGKIFSYIYKFNFNNKLKDYILIGVNINDSLNFSQKADVQWVSKKFIRKNKNKIYDIKRMQKMGFIDAVNAIDSNTVIYLIDIKIKKNRKYKAREVTISYPELL